MDLRITTSETILVFCNFANTGYCMFFFYKKKLRNNGPGTVARFFFWQIQHQLIVLHSVLIFLDDENAVGWKRMGFNCFPDS